MSCDSFRWSVELPEKGAASSWGVRPKAVVSLESAGCQESWKIPAAVGRKLNSLRMKASFEASSRAELAYKVKELSLSCGQARIEALVNKRDYSSKELVDKLMHDGYREEASRQLVEKAERCNLVNDERFATVYVRSKCYAGWGQRKIERELARKGIDCDSLPGWPEDFFEDGEEASHALDLARRRRLTGKNDFQKIVRFLCGKGYSMSVAIDAAKEVLDDAVNSE